MSDPKAPVRSFRIPDRLYAEVRRVAEEEDRTLSATVRTALKLYCERSPHDGE